METQRERFLAKAGLFCWILGVVVLFGTALSMEPIGSALGFAGDGSAGAWSLATTPPAYTTHASVFLPILMRNATGTTTYAAFLRGGPTTPQLLGTGGLFGFGIILGLLLVSEKPLWPFSRSKR